MESGDKDMWGDEFDVSAIRKGEVYVVNCPTEELERELASELDNIGLRYPDGEPLSERCHWSEYEEDFCYFIYRDYVVRRGTKSGASDSDGAKFTFCGVNTPDFETATDDELRAFLGIGGA